MTATPPALEPAGLAVEGAAPGRTGMPTPALAALLTVYVIWGSTYLAIRYAIQSIPPMLMAGVRFVTAGAILYAWSRARGGERPRPAQWRAATIVGALLLLCGNGGVVWAEQRVPSGIAALIVAVVPLWMVLLDWLRPGGERPRTGVFVGVALGLAGLVFLVGPSSLAGGGGLDRAGLAALVLASLTWAIGSLYTRGADLPASPVLANGMEMLAGGVLLLIAGLASGELAHFAPRTVTPASALALVYLITFGAIIGFTAYTYLLRAVPPAIASTYAYVNPVVAVILGWAIAGEAVTGRTVIAAAVILAGVAIITLTRTAKR